MTSSAAAGNPAPLPKSPKGPGVGRAAAGASGAVADLAAHARVLVHRRPLLSAVLVVLSLLLLAIVVFRPSYDTNDDPTMALIAAGKVICEQPDEHLIFTHFFIGLLLKRLYLLAPAMPWYGVYLFAVHAAAHIALVYMLFKQRLGWRWVAVYLAYAGIVGLSLVGGLQFTTTAFLAAQSGMFLGWFAFLRAVDGDARVARRCGIAGALMLIIAALIRWHVFMLFLSLAVPTACVLTWTYRHHRRLLVTGSALTALLIAAIVGLAKVNDLYYWLDPRWHDFYRYNELRARINDLAWVYYSPETAHVFPQVGWSVNDYGMIQAWFYDDPEVYSAAKLGALLGAYPWRESRPVQTGIADLLHALAADPQILPFLALLPCMVFMVGRNKTAQAALLLTCVWVVAMLWISTVLRKPPPPRIYLPLLSFPSALALFLGATLRRSLAGSSVAQPLKNGTGSEHNRRKPEQNGSVSVPVPVFQNATSDAPTLPRGGKLWLAARLAFAASCVLLAAVGAVSIARWQYDRGVNTLARSEIFYGEMASLSPRPDKLFVGWGATMPFELLRPTDSMQDLSDLRMLQFGWTQQCAFHADMKRRFGVEDFPRALGDRPDITLVCHPACLTLMTNYIRQHHGREVTFEHTGQFFNAVIAHTATTSADIMASGPKLQRD